MERARNEISVKNKYWISKHRYLELKHFCLQYSEWKRLYNSISELPPSKSIVEPGNDSSDGYFMEKTAINRGELLRQMDMVEMAAKLTDAYLYPFIFKAVTQGAGYTALHESGMACGKDMFYDRYHKFFWLLDKAR